MKATIKRYGLYGAGTLIVLSFLGWFIGKGQDLDFGTQEIIGYVTIVVALSFVFFGIKHFRDRESNGSVSFLQALKIGLWISLITGLAFGFLDIIYKLIYPDFTTEYYNVMVEQAKASVPAEELDAKLAEMEAQKEFFANPVLSFLVMTLTVFVIGFIVSLFSSLVLQRKNATA